MTRPGVATKPNVPRRAISPTPKEGAAMQMNDTYGDIIEVDVDSRPDVLYLILFDSDIEPGQTTEAQVELTPKKARKLAIALLKAAEKVEAQR